MTTEKSPNVNNVPLTEEKDIKSWVEFMKFAEGTPLLTQFDKKTKTKLWPVNDDDPFVSVLHDFATGAFNEVVHMYGKYGKSDMMSGSEVMSCKYQKVGSYIYFYMMIEAIEHGELGVHEFIVGCHHIDGSLSLVSKERTGRTPTGKIATMLPKVKDKVSKYKTLIDMKKDVKKKIKLERAQLKSVKKGKDKHEIAAKLRSLEEEHKAIQGECVLLYGEFESAVPKGWMKRRVNSSWYKYKANTWTTGLTDNGSGYNYTTRLFMQFPFHALLF